MLDVLSPNSADIAAGDYARFRVPDDSCARFTTSEIGDDFYVVATIDSNPDDAVFPDDGWTDPDQQNMAFDWGLSGVPTSLLSTQVLVGFAPSIDPTHCTGPSGGGSPFICDPPNGKESGSPVWVMLAATTKSAVIYIDHDGDPSTGAVEDDLGNKADKKIDLIPFARAKIFDEVDGDNTGTLVYTTDGTPIVAAWGQDPDTSNTGNPYFDAGTYIPALPLFTMDKEVNKQVAKPGETLTYTVNTTNISRTLITDLTMVDTLPLPEGVVAYNAGTTKQDGIAVPDKALPDNFPLLAPDGLDLTILLPNTDPLSNGLLPGETTSVTFDVTIDPNILPNDEPDDDCPDPQTALINNAIVSSGSHSFDDDALTCVVFEPKIDIEKLTNGVDADNPNTGDAPQIAEGDTVNWLYVVTNTGDIDLVNVTVVDDQGVSVSCPQTTLLVGESMDCTASGIAEDLLDTSYTTVPGVCGTIPEETPLYENKGKATGETAQGVPVEDTDPSHYCNDIPMGGEGCTPGYWKQKHHFDSWTSPYDPDDMFVSAGFDDAFPDMTLLEVLKQGGGGLKALGRHSVAALLNAESDGVEYDLTTGQVINGFNDVYEGTKQEYNTLKGEFEYFNELGCPLN